MSRQAQPLPSEYEIAREVHLVHHCLGMPMDQSSPIKIYSNWPNLKGQLYKNGMPSPLEIYLKNAKMFQDLDAKHDFNPPLHEIRFAARAYASLTDGTLPNRTTGKYGLPCHWTRGWKQIEDDLEAVGLSIKKLNSQHYVDAKYIFNKYLEDLKSHRDHDLKPGRLTQLLMDGHVIGLRQIPAFADVPAYEMPDNAADFLYMAGLIEFTENGVAVPVDDMPDPLDTYDETQEYTTFYKKRDDIHPEPTYF